MFQFISVPCKKGYDVKFSEIISAYVKEIYGEDQRNKHTNAFTEFNNMRSKMLTKLFDKHESTLNVLTRYLDQFVALESKIPIEENGVRIDFKWDDAFAKDSLFGKKGSLKIASGAYERICVLYNIAAVYSQVAENSNLSDDVGLKAAAKYFQQAAGIFSYLKTDVPNTIQREPTIDLNTDTLSTLNVIMLAQSQELIYVKSVRDNHKDGNIAKISQQAADLYADALKLMQINSVKSIWPKDWIPLVAGKQAGYHAMAEYYQGRSCGANQMFGEQIARFKKASELMKTASTRAGAKFLFRSEQERMKRELETVEKENNVIYHDKIPDISTLSTVPKAVLAREIPIDNPMNKDFKDLFENIVPLAVNLAMNQFQNKRNTMINAEVCRLKEATNTLSGIMASLCLPGALDDSGDDQVSPELLSKAAVVRKEGGVDKIEDLFNGLPVAQARNLEILNESVKMLDDEQESDTKLREQFKDRWNRTPSAKLTESWHNEKLKFFTLLDQAKAADDVVRKLYQEHATYIKILSQNEAAIKDAIPKSSSSQSGSQSADNVKGILQKLCKDVDALKTARSNLINEITVLETGSIVSVFNKAITEQPGLDQDAFADEQLNLILIPVREKVRQSIQTQEELVVQLQERSTELNKYQGTNSGENRAAVISSLMLAFEKFHELKSNLQEGLKFYADLTEVFLKYQNKVKDFCFARKTEKDELMKDLQATIVTERTDAHPTRSSNIQATSGGTDMPPQHNTTVPPTRPAATYNVPTAAATGQFPTPNAPMINLPGVPPAQPHGLPYPTNPYNVAPTYMPGQPAFQQYPYPAPPQMPQYPPNVPGGFPQYQPASYAGYPGYNPYYPR